MLIGRWNVIFPRLLFPRRHGSHTGVGASTHISRGRHAGIDNIYREFAKNHQTPSTQTSLRLLCHELTISTSFRWKHKNKFFKSRRSDGWILMRSHRDYQPPGTLNSWSVGQDRIRTRSQGAVGRWLETKVTFNNPPNNWCWISDHIPILASKSISRHVRIWSLRCR